MERWKLPCDSFSGKMDGFSGKVMPYQIAEKYFYREKDKNPMIENTDRIRYTDKDNIERVVHYIYVSGTSYVSYYFQNNGYDNYSVGYHDQIKLPIYQLKDNEKADEPFFVLLHGLNIFEDSKKNNMILWINKLLFQKRLIFSEKKFHLENIEDNEVKKIIDGEVEQLYNVSFKKEDMLKEITSPENICSEKMYQKLTQWLLECDHRRVNMEKYSEKILQDPESGHWDLWGESEKNHS